MASGYGRFVLASGNIRGFSTPVLQAFQITSATGDGVTDDTTAIQRDIQSLPAGGGCIYFPPGTYRVSAPIIINQSGTKIVGSGIGTQFVAIGDYGHVFDARPDVDPTVALAFTDILFEAFYINSPQNRTKGCGIHTKWTHAATFRDVRIGTLQVNDPNPVYFYDGISLENESAAVIENCQINCRHYGVYFSGQKVAPSDYLGTNYWNGLITGNCNIWGDHSTNLAGSAGVYIAGGTGGIQLEQCGISHFENGVRVTGSNRELFIGHCFAADDIAGHGFLIDVGALLVLQMTGAWAAGCGRTIGGDGIHIADGSFAMLTCITGGTFYSNVGYGIYVGQGQVMISGCTIISNGSGPVLLTNHVTGACITGTSMLAITNQTGATVKLRGNLGVADSG